MLSEINHAKVMIDNVIKGDLDKQQILYSIVKNFIRYTEISAIVFIKQKSVENKRNTKVMVYTTSPLDVDLWFTLALRDFEWDLERYDNDKHIFCGAVDYQSEDKTKVYTFYDDSTLEITLTHQDQDFIQVGSDFIALYNRNHISIRRVIDDVECEKIIKKDKEQVLSDLVDAMVAFRTDKPDEGKRILKDMVKKFD